MTSVPHSGAKSVTPGGSVAGGAAKFRDELVKIMPGYQWTVHKRPYCDERYMEATGVQSSGFNHLSTLSVKRRAGNGRVEYEVKSAGFGTRAKWLHTNTDGTLARALRGLQDHYQHVAALYRGHAVSLQSARTVTALGATGGETAGGYAASEGREVNQNPTQGDGS